MDVRKRIGLGLFVIFCAVAISSRTVRAQGPTGEVHFIPDGKVEKSAGVWVDGQYVGYVDDLKGRKTLHLGAGNHEIIVREAGYKEWERKTDIAAGGALDLVVKLELDPNAKYSAETVELKIHAVPSNAAVYVDDKFAGTVHDFGGIGHSMLLPPGKPTIKISMPGYQDYVTEMDMASNQKYRIETKLSPGTSETAAAPTKQD